MRTVSAIVLMLLVGLLSHAADKPKDEAKLLAAIEKAGVKVKNDASDSEPSRWKLSLPKWDPIKLSLLKGSPQVVEIVVEDSSKVTDQTMTLFASLPNLEKLELFKPSLTASGLNSFKNHKKLKSLTLFDAKVGDIAVANLKDVQTLEELDLTGTLITNQAAGTFHLLSNLKTLTVANTKFNGRGALQLREMTQLKELNALNCDITQKEAMELEEAIKGIKIKR